MRKVFFALLFVSCTKHGKLEDMNNVTFPEYKEITSRTTGSITYKVLVIGNSITTHPIAEDIGWKYESGMAASRLENDYVHLLFDKLNKQKGNIILRYANYSFIERNPDQIDFNAKKIKDLKMFEPDVLIYQLGDNVSAENAEIFKNTSVELVKVIAPKKTIVLSPFFKTKVNFADMKKIAKQTNSTFIDMDAVSDNPLSKAKNDISNKNNASIWKSEGIGLHPGDKGMEQISELILQAL
ncbi:SGNH/GDSL hydrolase family protein [Chryseobacterium sp. L7]|uniref:SGNH/GDSL hydrolase family protein n=1 Tax=Chryseobacterium endalhagicum TaxID=2797638 RepID=A0ABS1QFY2_9FLAO|nr:SGNH/GDSL hydrolase family protein [Chryseobacterium endalhagicum]MBL1221202.1 SGNH/GDSL hydrolase family protein [Chryseobacterium endalhagicum]